LKSDQVRVGDDVSPSAKRVNKALVAGGVSSGVASLLHVAILLGGPEWYRFFGAGEGMARLAQSGSAMPAIVTAAIAAVLATWALYAFSGAGLIRRLPLLRLGLVIPSTIYLVRGLLGIPAVVFVDRPYLNELEARMTFMVMSSLICLACGWLYASGTAQVWASARRGK
jgi:putative oxidoreductase